MMKYNIPILFVVFNRPQIAIKSFQEIKKAKPKRLYLASDAPRETKIEEKELVEETRKLILDSIDWECEVKMLFQEKNLGCGLGVYTAINWLFDNEEYGIILEDDCVVDSSFFPYMEEMLLRYASDNRIGMIAGTNPIEGYVPDTSYVFSKYKSCWGWASWRRAWKNMDISMNWRSIDSESVFRNAGYCAKDYSGWKYKVKCIDKNVVSAWDWQWYLSLSAQNQLCVYPAFNLVSNIGTDENATHTSGSNITLERYSLNFPLRHPLYVMPDDKFDNEFYREANSISIRLKRLLPPSLKKTVKNIITNLKG